MSLLNWPRPSKFTTFDDKALKDGALRDAVSGMAAGESPRAAIVKAITGVPMKNIFSSKLNWLGLFTAVAPFVAPVMDAIPPQYKPWIVAAGGILTMLLRTFATSQAVTLPGSDKPLATPPSGG